MATKLIVATFGIDKSFEIQTDETPARLVATVFWSELSAMRLRESEAQEYALLFAASPALLAACKATLEDLQIASETYETCHEEPGFRSGSGRNPADLDVTLETQDQLKAAITMAEKGK